MKNSICIALMFITSWASWTLDLSENIQNSHQNGRDEQQYFLDMDASFATKWQLIVPAIEEYQNSHPLATICDVGTGTGLLAAKLAAFFSSFGVRIVATDIIADYVSLAREKYSFANLSFHHRSTEEPCLGHEGEGLTDIVIFSSVLHEAYSYGDDGDSSLSLKRAIENAHKSLVPHGRVIIRDFVAPSDKESSQLITLCHRRDDIKTAMHQGSPRYLTCANFADDFSEIRNKRETTRKDIRCQEIDSRVPEFRCYETNFATAYEFMYRKDFADSYDAELNERYGFLSLDAARKLLEEAGFRIVVLHSYQNDWIREHRLNGKITLSSRKDEELPFPDYQMFIVAEKIAW